MAAVETLITDHLDLWTVALKRKSAAGRGSSSKVELYGIRKLRELILELAVRGLLVPQDPNDEPAGELLKKIAAEKAKLAKEGSIKKDKPLPAISDEAVPFVVPHGWKWARIADIGYDFGQKTPDADFTYIDVGSIDNRLGLIDYPATLRAEDAPSRARKLVSRGTVIYSTVRPYLLNVAIVQKDFDPEPIASTAFAVVHPFEGVVSGYVYRYLRSPSFVAYVESVQTGIAYPAINDRQFFSGLIPLPPTAEQYRIVAKVDELMVLCDQFEQETEVSLGAHQTLVETLLSALTSAADHAQFASAWQRIVGHFDTLFTTEESIAQLKQTILQLAVMGKLVPQDPNDEPASELLKKIAAEKARLVKEGKIKKDKPLPAISDEEKSFDLPNGWAWTRLGGIGTVASSSRVHQKDWQSSGVPFFRTREIVVLSQHGFVNNELFISEELYQSFARNGLAPVAGDLMFTGVGTIGVPYVVAESDKFYFKDASVLIFKNHFGLFPRFLFYFMRSPCWINAIHERSMGTTVHTLTIVRASNVLIPLPPLAEQNRIVAKVDELMTLCDQLKSRLSEAKTTQLHLADALVERAIC